MTAIPENFGEGGANLAPQGAAGEPTLAVTLRDVADDLDALQIPTVTSPSPLAAAGANPTKAEYDATVTLLVEIKTKLNAIAAAVLKTTKA